MKLTRDARDKGDAGAQFQWAMWRLIGDPLPRDLSAARIWLARARLGQTDAAAVEIALTANGSGGPQNWQQARLLLDAATDDAAEVQRRLLLKMQLDDSGMPLEVPLGTPLTDDSRIGRFPAFLSPDECAHVAQAMAMRMEPALVVDPATGRQTLHPVRTSDSAVVSPTVENLALRAINLRIAAATSTHVDQGEPLTILRYRRGQQFRPHHDALSQTRNQRSMTMLIYLNEGFVGGETIFPSYDLSIVPKGGDAILFHNLLNDGMPDPKMRHAGAPVRQGSKWLATRWIRTHRYDPWRGPENI
ncbi:hypothetical protein ASG67_13165 [Sphingomonas sp. Leaf339]|nr:hypothetical protein ASG67_13165 [Sphingomonas sp. Leaf339]